MRRDARNWLNRCYFPTASPTGLSSIGSDRLLILPNFLASEGALLLYRSMTQLETWRQLCLALGDDRIEQSIVPATSWLALAPNRRFSRFDVAGVTTLETSQNGPAEVLRLFTETLSGQEFLGFVSRLIGRSVCKMVDFRMTRYCGGDFIVEHKDSNDGRIVRCNLYLDPQWNIANGGRLMFRSESGEVFAIEPVFNTLVLTQISDACTHWVETVECYVPTRYSMAFSFLPCA